MHLCYNPRHACQEGGRRRIVQAHGVLSHPQRIRIVEELGTGELDVNSLAELLGTSHSRVSQQLSILRSHRIVAERREGRHVFYRLTQPKLARWLVGGLDFLEGELDRGTARKGELAEARSLWGAERTRSKRGSA